MRAGVERPHRAKLNHRSARRWPARHLPSEAPEKRAAGLAGRAAERLLVAHGRTDEAESVARAVGFARSGEAWRPRDVRQEAEERCSALEPA